MYESRDEIEVALMEKRGEHEVYVSDIKKNLCYPEHYELLVRELGQGGGSELRGEPAKFRSVGSSSALAFNSFSWWDTRLAELELAGRTGFHTMHFEHKLPTGLHGMAPNLDVFLEGQNETICVEAKFLEPLSPKPAKFSDSYQRIRDRRASGEWYEVYKTLRRDPNAFAHLDVAQLIKHYFGITNPTNGLDRPVLVYLYWEPAGADHMDEYLRHQEELEDFKSMVEGDELLPFVSLSYAELWEEWRARGKEYAMHVDKLKQWYEV